MKKSVLVSTLVFIALFIANSADAQILNKLLNLNSRFNQVEVDSLTILHGGLILDDNLDINGNALFNGTVNALQGVIVDGDVKLRTLQNSLGNALVTVNNTGFLAVESADSIDAITLNGLTVGGTLNALQDVVVNGETQLNALKNTFDNALLTVTKEGVLQVENALTTIGEAITTAEEIVIDGQLILRGLQNEIEGIDGVAVLGVVTETGAVVVEDLSALVGGILAGLPGIQLPNLEPCLLGVSAPNSWVYSGNLIYTQECTQDPRIGIGTQTPQGALDVRGSSFLGGITAIGDGASKIIFSTNALNGNKIATLNSRAMPLQIEGNVVLNRTVEDAYLVSDKPSSTLYLGDPEHFIRSHQDEDMPGVTVATYENKGLFLREGGGAGFGGADATKADLHIKAQKEVALYIEDAAGVGVFKVNNNDGKVYAKEINVQTDVFPDYVFAKDYKLKSLEEVEGYIKENNRLPGKGGSRKRLRPRRGEPNFS